METTYSTASLTTARSSQHCQFGNRLMPSRDSLDRILRRPRTILKTESACLNLNRMVFTMKSLRNRQARTWWKNLHQVLLTGNLTNERADILLISILGGGSIPDELAFLASAVFPESSKPCYPISALALALRLLSSEPHRIRR